MTVWQRATSLVFVGSVFAIAATSACSSASKAQSEPPKATATSAGAATANGKVQWQDPWLGKADVSVFLCTAADPKSEGCAGGTATAAQRDAIQTQIQSFPETRQVFYESPQQAYENLKRLSPGDAANVTPEYMPQSFRVKLKDPSAFPDHLAGLRGTPGVALVTPVK